MNEATIHNRRNLFSKFNVIGGILLLPAIIIAFLDLVTLIY